MAAGTAGAGVSLQASRLSLQALLLLATAATLATAEKFKCPAFTKLTSDPYIFMDPEQCDKYWTCTKGESKRSLCPDGLVFHPGKSDGEDPCDLKANVPDKCKTRPKQRNPRPGDSHCPRQYGVYPSTVPGECDTYYTCNNGKSAATKCAEGLHFSDEDGVCVWARDSGRDDCDAEPESRRKKKKGGAAQQQESKPERKVAEKLGNGFVCPGGPIGVHPALPHPDDCRQYYVCLNGVDPSEAGCPPTKVFNPRTQQCDLPGNVDGCEDYYNPAARKKKAEVATSLGTDVDSGDFQMFLKLLKTSGVLSGGNILKSEAKPLNGGRPLSGRPGRKGPRNGGRPGKGGRRGPGRRRPRPRHQRPRGQGRFQEDYDYYPDYPDYDYPEPLPPAPAAESRTSVLSPRPRPVPSKLQPNDPVDTVRATPMKAPQKEVSARRGDGLADTSKSSARTGLFSIPANRKNIFTSKFIPKVKMVGNTENLAPVPTLANLPTTVERLAPVAAPEQPARAPVLPASGLSATDAEQLFSSLFPGLMATEAPSVVHPGLPEPVVLAPVQLSSHAPRSRNSLFSRSKKPREPAAVTDQPQEEQERKETPAPAPLIVEEPRFRNSFFNNRRQKPGRPVSVTERVTSSPTTPAPVIVEQEEETEEETEAPRRIETFPSRSRFRSRSRPVAVRTTTDLPATITTVEISTEAEWQPTVGVRHRFTPVAPTLPVTEPNSFRSFLKSRSRSSANGSRQPLVGSPRPVKPEPKILGGGSPPAPIPAPVLPTAPTRPRLTPVHNTPRLLDLARDFFPVPVPIAQTTQAPVTFPPTTIAPPTLPPSLPPSTSIPVVPAFLRQTNSGRSPAKSPAPLSRGRQFLNIISNEPSEPARLPHRQSFSTSFEPSQPQQAFRSLQEQTEPLQPSQMVRTRGQSSRPSPSPRREETLVAHRVPKAQTNLVRSRSRGSESDSRDKHMVVMQARSQLKPFLPHAENEGDALEKLRAKIESLQGTNRHRGRG